MATQQEEMRAKLVLDTSALGRAKQEFREFAETGKSGFVKVEEPARRLRGLMEKLTEQSPLLGGVLQAALSPVGAAITVATVALTFFNKKIDEWNERMDEAEHRNATAIFGLDAMRASAAEISKMTADHRKFMETREDESAQVMQALDEENQKLQDNLAIDQARLALNKQLAQEIIKRQVSSGSMSMAAGMTVLNQLGADTAAQSRKQQLDALGKRQTELGSSKEDIQTHLAFANADVSTLNEMRKANQKELDHAMGLAKKQQADYDAAHKEAERQKETGGSIFGQTAADIATAAAHAVGGHSVQERRVEAAEASDEKEKQRLERVNANVRKLQESQDKLNTSYDESKDKASKFGAALVDVNKQIAKTKEEQDKLSKSPIAPQQPIALSPPYEFGLNELGQYNSYYGAIARAIQFRQRYARSAAAFGNFDLSRRINETINPAGDPKNPNNLYNLLPPGMTREQNEAKRQQDLIASIMASLGASKDTGVPVTMKGPIPNAP